ncbi:MAG: hypothetical protein IPP49_04730 [Saprospiraceae bacterium]|nr:hypothetical protein [Saprospiraceae bacterium]
MLPHPRGNISGDQTHNLSQPATTSSEMPEVKNAVKLSDLLQTKQNMTVRSSL